MDIEDIMSQETEAVQASIDVRVTDATALTDLASALCAAGHLEEGEPIPQAAEDSFSIGGSRLTKEVGFYSR